MEGIEPVTAAAEPEAAAATLGLLRLFQDAGGMVVLGSDAINKGIAGETNHLVLELMVEPGVSPLETIRMASLDGAAYLGVSEEVGSIAAGKAADLLIVRGNPAERIGDIRTVIWVFKDGVAYDPVALRESVRGLAGWQ
jgi:imidazolonepropionase-like amidohydrolase